MSESRETTVACDCCGDSTTFPTDMPGRKWPTHWARVVIDLNGSDYCPKCWARMLKHLEKDGAADKGDLEHF